VSTPAGPLAAERALCRRRAPDLRGGVLAAGLVINRRRPEASRWAAREPAPDRPDRAGRRWPAARRAGSAASAATASAARAREDEARRAARKFFDSRLRGKPHAARAIA